MSYNLQIWVLAAAYLDNMQVQDSMGELYK